MQSKEETNLSQEKKQAPVSGNYNLLVAIFIN
jgi:hypothetical protein